jgi:ubiquinone biosynthesis protein UbiJ
MFSTPLLVAINHVLEQADWARLKLQPFAGRSVRIAMPPFTLMFAIGSDGRLQVGNEPADLDVLLAYNTPLLALQGNDQVIQAAQINGPADLADALSFVLRNLRWDIEEDLSRVFGDVVARRMATTLNAFAGWQREAAGNLSENIGEYLTEESRMLVRTPELTAFAAEIEQMCIDLAKLDTRMDALLRKM